MEKLKRNKGITLISLIITIVILIILATITVNQSLGDNGLFKKARQGAQEYKNAQDYEETEIAKTINEIDNFVGGNRTTPFSTPDLIYSGTTTELTSYNLIEGKSLANYNYIIIQTNNDNRSAFKMFSQIIPVCALDFTQTNDIELGAYMAYGVNMHFTSNTSFTLDSWVSNVCYIQAIYGL